MIYGVEYTYVDRYEWIRGGMYRKLEGRDQVRVCVLTAKLTEADDLARLIYLASHLKAVIAWDYSASPQVARLRLASAPGQLAVMP